MIVVGVSATAAAAATEALALALFSFLLLFSLPFFRDHVNYLMRSGEKKKKQRGGRIGSKNQ